MAVAAVGPQVLTTGEKRTISLFTSEESISEIFRRLEYVRTDSRVQIRLGKEVLVGIAVGGGVGAWGSLFAYLLHLTPPVPSPFFFVVKAAAIGATAGGMLGLASGIKTHVIEIGQSDEYQRWRAEAIRDRVLPIFKEFIQRPDVAREFLCPLTEELIQVPVKAADGRIYEQEAIEQWLTEKTRVLAYSYLGIFEQDFRAASAEERKDILARVLRAIPNKVRKEFSPFHTCYIRAEDLEYQPDYHKNLFRRLKEVFNREVDAQVREGLKRFTADVQMSKKQIAQALISEDAARLAVREISESEHLRKVRKIQQLVALEPLT